MTAGLNAEARRRGGANVWNQLLPRRCAVALVLCAALSLAFGMRHRRRADSDARSVSHGNRDGDTGSPHAVARARTYANRNPSYADARAILYSDTCDDGYRDARSDTSHAACANWDAGY